MVDQTTTDPQQAIKDQIAALQQQVYNAQQAGYGQGGQNAGQQIPANVLNAPTQTTQPTTSTFGADAGNTQGFQFGNILQTAIDRMNTIQPLTQARQLLMKNIYDTPLTPDEIKQLPQEYQTMVSTGDKQEQEMGLRLLNDQISNRTGTLDQSINYLTTQYTNSQAALATAKDTLNTHLLDLQKQWQAQGYDPNTSLQKAQQSLSLLYSKDQLAQLGVNFPEFSFLADTGASGTSGTGGATITSPSGTSYDMSTYASDPNYATDFQNTLNSIGKLNTPQDITNYISQTQGSPITADMVTSASQQYGVGWEELLALTKKECNLGTSAVCQNNNNPGGITWTQAYQDSHPGTSKGSARPASEGGNYVKFNTLQDGMNATAEQLANRKSTPTTSQYADLLKGKTQAQQNYFNSLAPNEQSLLNQVITGSALISDVAAGMGGAAARQRLLSEAQQVDPTFSENVNKRRYQFQQSWFNPTAAPFKTRTSINTALGHMAQAYTDFQSIDNQTIMKYNSLANMLSKETGNSAVTNFNYDITQLATEIAAAYQNGTQPGEQQINDEKNALVASFSPSQGKGVFDRAAKLLSSKITSTAEEYKGAMGTYPIDPIVQPTALQELQTSGVNIAPIVDVLKNQGYDVSGFATQSQSQTMIVGSDTYVLNPKTGKYAKQ